MNTTAFMKSELFETACRSLRAMAATQSAVQARKSPYDRALAFWYTISGAVNASPRLRIEAQFPKDSRRTRHRINSANDIAKELKSLNDVSSEPNNAAQTHPTAK